MWIMFDNIIKDMGANEKLSSLVIGLFMLGRKLNISIVFILKSYFKVFKDKKNKCDILSWYIPNERELQKIALNHLSDIAFKNSVKFYKDCNKEPCSFLERDTTLQL